jgi:tryptophan synthase beta subunit
MQDPQNKTYDMPDERGHFGQFGGIFVAETLVEALEELRVMYEKYRHDPAQFIMLSAGPIKWVARRFT